MPKKAPKKEVYDSSNIKVLKGLEACLLYTSPSPRDDR